MIGKNKLTGITLTAILYIAVFIFSINLPTDPDLGWHLKYGQYFLKTGEILRENIFSTMMPNYNWVNHSWLSDILIYVVYNYAGFIGISLLGAGIVTLTFFVLSKAFKLDLWAKAFTFPLLLILVSNVNAVSFRSQMMSYFFTTILIYILVRYEENPRKLLFALPLFLIWANFHGGFIVGLTILGGYIAVRKLILFKDNLKNLNPEFIFNSIKLEASVVFGVLLVTLINPFGYGVYLESLNHFGNPWLKYVSEWAAFEDLSQQWWKLIFFVNLYLVGILFLFLNGNLRKNLTFVILIFLFMILSFYERRYAWSMYYISLPILIGISGYLRPPSKSIQKTAVLIISSIFLIIALNFKEPPSYYLSMNWDRFCLNASNACSYGAINFIKKNNLTENLSTPYSWGGWMIWNFPEVKPSIDGRMHLWKDETGYSAFGQYYTNVQDWESIDKSKYNTVLVLKQKPMFKRLKKLTGEKKWRWVYEDNVSAIFIRI